MASGLSAKKIYGSCVEIPQRICDPYKEVNIHVLTSTPYPGTGFLASGNTWGCNARVSTPNTQPLPKEIIPKAYADGSFYGKTTNEIELPNFFYQSHLANWRQRSVIQYGPQTIYARGPSIKQGHSITTLRRRNRNQNKNYQGKNSFYFTDSYNSLNGLNDWLGFLHPGDVVWTNKDINEPFMAVDFFEDCGQIPVKTDIYNQVFIPFCTPLSSYDSLGNLLGIYSGYIFMFYFGKAFMKFPFNKFLPEDYYVPVPPRPFVIPTQQFFTLDCHLFMVADPYYTDSLKSPKLNSARIWHYNKDSVDWDICNQYMYCLGAIGDWSFNVKFNHIEGTEETINFGMNSLKFYITP
jgi:hypothetical protein